MEVRGITPVMTAAVEALLRRLTTLYAQRRKRLIECLHAEMGDSVRILGDASGLHLVLQLAGKPFGRAFSHACRRQGLLLATAEDYRVRQREPAGEAAQGGSGARWAHDDKLVVGYGHLDDDGIRSAVVRLAEMGRLWNGTA